MRRPIAHCACVLALITGAWVGQAYTLFAPAEPLGDVDPSSQRATATAWRYYDAIDLLLRTGDDGALREIIAPDFVDHVEDPASATGRDGLVNYLGSLRKTHPALRLVPEDVIADGDRVVARIAPPEVTDGTVLGIPLAGVIPWPRIDVVRVRGDRIAERWGDPAGYALASALYEEALTATRGGDLVPVFQRVTLAPGASDQALTRMGPAIIFLESGDLDIDTEDAIAPPTRAQRRSEDAPSSGAGRAHTLRSEDTLVVPDLVEFAATNRMGEPAVMLLLTLMLPTQDSAQPFERVSVLPGAGVTVRALAGGSILLRDPDRITAELARVTLAPGMRLSPHEVTGVEFVAIDAGTVTVAVAGNGFSAWRQDANGRSTAFGQIGQVEEGFGLSVSGKGTGTTYRNETARPVVLLLLKLTSDGTSATHEGGRLGGTGGTTSRMR